MTMQLIDLLWFDEQLLTLQRIQFPLDARGANSEAYGRPARTMEVFR